MIEKIDEIDIETFPMGDAGAQILTILAHINGAKRKINEVIDAVNKLDALLDLTNTAMEIINLAKQCENKQLGRQRGA